MHYNTTLSMSDAFEAEKNKKALAYTAVVLGTMFLLVFFVTWELPVVPAPPLQDLIEINLGNDIEGFGKVQPLIKGEKAPSSAVAEQPRAATPVTVKAEETKTDDNDKEAAPVAKTAKTVVKVTTPLPVVVPEPKPQKPKYAGYQGTPNGKGNGATETNGYTYQGNKPGGKGDAGSPNGNPDSYGNSPGGKVGGGPRVTSGDRKIIRYYSFTADLEKAIIYAIIKIISIKKPE